MCRSIVDTDDGGLRWIWRATWVDAVVLEGRSYREVARAHGVSESWVAKVLARHRAGGLEALEPRSRAPRTIAHRTPVELEDEIVSLRKGLAPPKRRSVSSAS